MGLDGHKHDLVLKFINKCPHPHHIDVDYMEIKSFAHAFLK